MDVTVTMSREMYNLLLHGRKGTADLPGVKACVTPEKLVEYVNAEFGLLGNVAEVISE